MEEVWKPIPGYEGFYEASNNKQIRSVDRVITTKSGITRKLKGKILNQHQNQEGYWFVGLSLNGIIKYRLVHILVASSFPEICGYPFEGSEINHKDENKSNNTPENLEYMLHADNINYGTGIKRHALSISKEVIQFDRQGNFIKKWNQIRKAALTLKVSEDGISRCCQGKQNKCGGFKWKYA